MPIDPWWPVMANDSAFHTATGLPGGEREGLLVDIGAYENLMGDGWVRRVSKQALRAGQKVSIDEQQGLGGVCEVGGTNVINHKAT
eukprot:812263-Prorocentrum_lima.AAC.1